MSKNLTPAEAQIKAETEAALAAGGDPFGDNEEIVAASIEDQAKEAQAKLDRANGTTTDENDEPDDAATTTEATEATTTATTEATTEATTTEADEDDDLPDENEPVALQTVDPVKAEADIAALQDQKDALHTKMMDGELDAKEFNAEARKIDTQINTLNRALAVVEVSAQQVFAYQSGVLKAIAADAKKAGVLDYADAKAQSQFNTALQILHNDPANANRSFKAIAKEAHATVLAIRGIATARAKPAAAAPAAPAARATPKPPVTLRDLPSAATPNSGGSLLDNMSKLSGAAYEKAYSKLTDAQKATLLGDD